MLNLSLIKTVYDNLKQVFKNIAVNIFYQVT
jgi:hypothetical protein